MPASKRGGSLFVRSPLGFWFCGIAALSLLQFWLRAFDGDRFQPTGIAWAWLAGGLVLAVLGLVLVVRELRRRQC